MTALSDVKIMLEKYPDVKNTNTEKLLSQIEENQKIAVENQRKANNVANRKTKIPGIDNTAKLQ